MIQLHPPSTALIGPAGTGKTTSLVTLIEAGLKLRMLATEPTAPNRVLDEIIKRKLNPDDFDWEFISPATPSWESLKKAGVMVKELNLKQIADLPPDKLGEAWIKLLNGISNFKSDKTGKDLGDATEWGPEFAFCIDGLSGINVMSRNLTIGLKPNPAPGEWGVMQNNILSLIGKLTADTTSFLVLIAHVEREANEITGMTNITLSTIGAKLAPKLPPLFSNVIYAKRKGMEFSWSTAETGVDTKPTDLPMSDNLPPNFTPIIAAFTARQKLTGTSPVKVVA